MELLSILFELAILFNFIRFSLFVFNNPSRLASVVLKYFAYRSESKFSLLYQMATMWSIQEKVEIHPHEQTTNFLEMI